MHGEDDQIVPIADSALISVKLRQARHAEDLSRPAARHALDPSGAHQRRPAGLHQGVSVTSPRHSSASASISLSRSSCPPSCHSSVTSAPCLHQKSAKRRGQRRRADRIAPPRRDQHARRREPRVVARAPRDRADASAPVRRTARARRTPPRRGCWRRWNSRADDAARALRALWAPHERRHRSRCARARSAMS